MNKKRITREKRSAAPLPAVLTIATVAKELHISNNSKAGLCLDMKAGDSCPGKTEACYSPKINKDGSASESIFECYATHPPYGWHQKRYGRNMELISRSLIELGIEQTAKAVSLALATNKMGHVPRIRLHGSGDIFSLLYAKMLIALAKLMPHKRFWLYTRSWRVPTLLPAIIELAALPNVDVNLSTDYVNWEDCVDVFLANPVFNAVACMQEKNATWIQEMVNRGIRRDQIVIFPQHIPNQHVEPVRGLGRICPEIMGAFQEAPVPCLSCKSICHKGG